MPVFIEPNQSSRGRRTQTSTIGQLSKINPGKRGQKPETPKYVKIKEILTSRSRSLSLQRSSKGTVHVLPT